MSLIHSVLRPIIGVILSLNLFSLASLGNLLLQLRSQPLFGNNNTFMEHLDVFRMTIFEQQIASVVLVIKRFDT